MVRVPALAGTGARTRAAPAQCEIILRGSPVSLSRVDHRRLMTAPYADTPVAERPGVVDSHCHLDFPDFEGKVESLRDEMRESGVTHALCISVNLRDFPKVLELAQRYDNFFASVGVHPDHEDHAPISEDELLRLASHPKVVAIGETGLDYSGERRPG